MRGLVPAFVAAIAVGLGLVAADTLLTQAVERLAATRVSNELGSPAEVDLDGFPVTLRVLLTSTVPRAVVTAVDVPLEDTEARLDRVRVELLDVTATFDGGVDAAGGTFSAEIGEENLQRLVGLPDDIEITALRLGDGVAELTLGGVPVVSAAATLVEGGIELRPTGDFVDQLSLTVDLGGLPDGVVVDEVVITPGIVTLRGRIDDLGFLDTR